MPGIPWDVIEHALCLILGSKPTKERLRRFDDERRRAIGEEITKLLAAGFIREVFHSDWLANPILVKKKIGKWRMYVDYTGLNKACPKDHFSLPRIDQIVDSTSGCEILSFLNACSGYHQIAMKESDQLVTSFITPYGSYCYVTMPVSLKNAGTTYQRCMQQCFADQIDPPAQPDQAERLKPTIAVYVNDIVVKTAQACNLIANLAATFANLQRFNIKLNPKKCVFGVPKGKLLGYIVFEHGIEANPKKSRPFPTWAPYATSRAYKGSPAVWLP